MKSKQAFFFLIIGILLSTENIFAKEVKITVKGMVCAFCAQGIEKKFKTFKDVQSVNVNLSEKKVTLQTTETHQLTKQIIEATLKDAGFELIQIEGL